MGGASLKGTLLPLTDAINKLRCLIVYWPGANRERRGGCMPAPPPQLLRHPMMPCRTLQSPPASHNATCFPPPPLSQHALKEETHLRSSGRSLQGGHAPFPTAGALLFCWPRPRSGQGLEMPCDLRGGAFAPSPAPSRLPLYGVGGAVPAASPRPLTCGGGACGEGSPAPSTTLGLSVLGGAAGGGGQF